MPLLAIEFSFMFHSGAFIITVQIIKKRGPAKCEITGLQPNNLTRHNTWYQAMNATNTKGGATQCICCSNKKAYGLKHQ